MLLTNRLGQPQMGEALASALSTADRIWFVSAYVSPDGCEKLKLTAVARRATLHVVVGRALAEGLSRETVAYLSRLHDLASSRGGGVCAANPPCHSKVYVIENGAQVRAWIGSSNLTSNGMHNWPEANLEVSGLAGLVLLAEVKTIYAAGVALTEVHEVEIPRPVAERPGGIEKRQLTIEEPGSVDGAPSLSLSLLTQRTGDVAEGSGLNWWNGGGRTRSPNEAYVALPVHALDDAAEVFGSSVSGTRFRAICHDGRRFEMSLEGKQRVNQAKQISTAGDKRVFGQWILRECLHLPEGKLVTRRDLQRYGRTDIRFTRIGADDNGEPLVYVDFRPDVRPT